VPYALWEFYSYGDSEPFIGKAIEVDVNHQKQGIGKSFCEAVLSAGYRITPSGTQTGAGAALLNSINWSESS
jgi:hypothetical protein